MLDETFRTPLPIDLIAVGVGSLQGAMFAAGFKRIDLLGVAIIGTASGIGGGFLRDILLGVTPASFSENLYLIVATGAAFIGMLLSRLLEKVDPLITVLDALSIGMFGAIGTTKALAMGLPVVPALFIGTVSAVGGGVLRDVMLNIPIALMHVGSLYAVASLVGVSTLAALLALGVPVMIAGVACVIVTAVLRLLAVRFGWSLPEQRALSRIRLRRQRQVEQVIEEALHTGAITVELDLRELRDPDLDPPSGGGPEAPSRG
ncbi:trimeric intracellular cation channel family protein [Leucobacter luti]|uniref:Putative membrane protein YeiH n=1 Tax=Leucobacter luti TaxID=340320 RepID=A0A4R6RZ36_9MICO|nr:TRIC cation channel family protein [Leucobacter luti]QYM76191.1 TRIC cation channel family protein [Leucobacter luti]TDP92449.1 putative membrane protein YeiH [Leucobacter luti]